MTNNTKHYIKISTSIIGALAEHRKDLAKYLAIIKSAPIEKREKILRSIGTIWPETQISSTAPALDNYANIDGVIASKITLGIKVGEGLTRSERHEWLVSGAKLDPSNWLVRNVQVSQVRSLAVARWILHINASDESRAALYRENRWGSLASHVSDLIDDDVANHDDGSRPGVNAVAARRDARLVADEFGEDLLHEIPRWLSSLGGRVRPLTTGVSLAAEGRLMSHCVGGYVSQVKSGRSVICAVSAFGERATVEYTHDGEIVQIKGARNSAAGKIARRVAELAVKK
jgi:hypothetical protein